MNTFKGISKNLAFDHLIPNPSPKGEGSKGVFRDAFKLCSLTAVLLFVMTSASAQSSQVLNANDFEKKMESVRERTLLDVRTESEYTQGHLANATLIDFYKKDFKLHLSKLDKNKPIFLYCAVGGRSSSASKILAELNFKEVYDLQGGMSAWKNANKAILK